jgi:hypothetical protein
MALTLLLPPQTERVAPPSLAPAPPSAKQGVEETTDGPVPRPLLGFRRLDLNHDERLTAEELAGLPAEGRERFVAADQNGDGVVTLEELQRRVRQALNVALPQWPQNMLLMFDRDGDGALRPEELPRHPLHNLMQGDLDGDGRLVEKELHALQQGRAAALRQGTGQPP